MSEIALKNKDLRTAIMHDCQVSREQLQATALSTINTLDAEKIKIHEWVWNNRTDLKENFDIDYMDLTNQKRNSATAEIFCDIRAPRGLEAYTKRKLAAAVPILKRWPCAAETILKEGKISWQKEWLLWELYFLTKVK